MIIVVMNSLYIVCQNRFNFRFWFAFIAWPTERERSNFQFSIRNWRQRVTSQHTVNANELCTMALPG